MPKLHRGRGWFADARKELGRPFECSRPDHLNRLANVDRLKGNFPVVLPQLLPELPFLLRRHECRAVRHLLADEQREISLHRELIVRVDYVAPPGGAWAVFFIT